MKLIEEELQEEKKKTKEVWGVDWNLWPVMNSFRPVDYHKLFISLMGQYNISILCRPVKLMILFLFVLQVHA